MRNRVFGGLHWGSPSFLEAPIVMRGFYSCRVQGLGLRSLGFGGLGFKVKGFEVKGFRA